MKNKEYVNLENKPVFSKNILILLLTIALLGAIGYIVYERYNAKRATWIVDENIIELEKSRELLKQELRLTRAEYDSAKNIVIDKSVEIQEQDRQIFEKQKKIQDLLNSEKISKRDLKNAKDLIASLQIELRDYKDQIEILKKENKTLIAQNTDLQSKNSEVNFEKNKISATLSDHISQREAERANIRATLSISNYNLQGLKVRNSGKEIETERASRINKVRLTFDIDRNLNASNEPKEIYLAFYKPDGTLGKFDGSKSGKLPLRVGSTVEYSDVVMVDFDPKIGSKVSLEWKDYNFEKGTYMVNIYHNGFKIGQNTIQLK